MIRHSGKNTKVSWSGLGVILTTETKKILKKNAYQLNANIKAAWPVKSGRSKAGWHVRGHRYGWTIVNNVVSPEGHDYVPRLWAGLPLGSNQLPNGGDPIVMRQTRILKKDLQRLEL